MQLVFDLDGCVIDNRNATRLSYELAGVTEFPKDWYHVSGWATPEQRRIKAGLYPRLLHRLGKLRTIGRLLLQTGGVVISGCSRDSLDAVLEVFPVLTAGNVTCLCEHALDDKIRYLNTQKQPGLYFDDWDWACKRVREETRWTTIDTSRL